MADEPALDAKYEGLRRGLRSRRRDDHALDLFRRAEANLADVRQVDRILLELGRFYNPLTNRPIVDLATRRSIVERLEAGRLDEARQLLDDCVARYAPPDGPAPPASGVSRRDLTLWSDHHKIRRIQAKSPRREEVPAMAPSLSDSLQHSRLTVVEVDKIRGRLRVRGPADACTDLACSDQAVVVAEGEMRADLALVNPGDIIKIEPAAGPAERIVVLRRAWEEIASPEI